MTDQTTPPFEYHLSYWGEAGECIEDAIGTADTDFWFASAAERLTFKAKLQAVADFNDQRICFAEHEGTTTRLRTIARMVMVTPDGKRFPYVYDFGFGYEPDSARFMFFDGNYSCDCNKSLFLMREHRETFDASWEDESGQWPCGDEIRIEGFVVTLEATAPEVTHG